MKTSFLEYYKIILDRVSFDKKLLAKEYVKAKKALKGHEISELDRWLNNTGLRKSLIYNDKQKTPFQYMRR